MKKIIALLLAAAFVCGTVVGCGSPTTAPAKTPGTGAGTPPTKTS